MIRLGALRREIDNDLVIRAAMSNVKFSGQSRCCIVVAVSLDIAWRGTYLRGRVKLGQLCGVLAEGRYAAGRRPSVPPSTSF